MLSKNLPFFESLYKIPIRFVLDGINAWKDLFSGNSTTLKAVFNAHLHTVKWLFIGKKNHQRKKNMKALQGVFNGSIVWQYFIKKQTKFSQIFQSNH